jgi:hypothetical protein
MKLYRTLGVRLAMAGLSFLLCYCNGGNDPLPIRFIESTFESDLEEWSGDFAYTKTGTDALVKFKITQAPLPETLKSELHGLKLEGHNSGDSIFLFIKKKITGLDPAKTYKVAYQINLATNFPDTLAGAGRIIYLKAGASTTEPTSITGTGISTVSIQNGALAKSGTQMRLLGNVANGLDSTYYKPITRSNANVAVPVTPDVDGNIWLCVGINTTFKGDMALFFDRIYAAIGEKTVVK